MTLVGGSFLVLIPPDIAGLTMELVMSSCSTIGVGTIILYLIFKHINKAREMHWFLIPAHIFCIALVSSIVMEVEARSPRVPESRLDLIRFLGIMTGFCVSSVLASIIVEIL